MHHKFGGHSKLFGRSRKGSEKSHYVHFIWLETIFIWKISI